MNIFETTVTVKDHGQVHIAGAPFEPGTEVEVTIREKIAEGEKSAPANTEEPLFRMKDLFGRVRAKNTDSVGPLCREELYDRDILR